MTAAADAITAVGSAVIGLLVKYYAARREALPPEPDLRAELEELGNRLEASDERLRQTEARLEEARLRLGEKQTGIYRGGPEPRE